MATSGVSNFDPTFDEILQDAIAMVGGGPILAEELTAGQRGVDLMLISIQNRNILLHKIETTTITVSASVGSYAFDNTILDVLYASAATSVANSGSNQLERHGYERWAELPSKDLQGRPTSYWFDRRRNGNILNIWPTPDTDYVVELTIQKTVEDTVRAFNNVDVPRRFIPALTYGLAYWIGLRRSSRVPTERLTLLKNSYEQELREAMREDRERGSIFIRFGR